MSLPRLPPLLNLPLELFLMICDLLPLSSRASLVLTCRPLHHQYKYFTLDLLRLSKDQTTEHRLQRLYLLRLLRRDLSFPSPLLLLPSPSSPSSPTVQSGPFLCHSCLKFHEPNKPGIKIPHDYEGVTLPSGSGFPYCNSAYTFALQDIWTRLSDRADRGISIYRAQCTISSILRLNYEITIDVNHLGLYMQTKLSYSDTRPYSVTMGAYGQRKEGCTAEDFGVTVRSANLDVCPHLRLAGDFTEGDGSLSDVVERGWKGRRKEYARFERMCKECGVYFFVKGTPSSGIDIWVRWYPEYGKPLNYVGEEDLKLGKLNRLEFHPKLWELEKRLERERNRAWYRKIKRMLRGGKGASREDRFLFDFFRSIL